MSLSVLQIGAIKRLLASHHSRDLNHIALLQQEMADDAPWYPWKCGDCAHINRKGVAFCARCGSSHHRGTVHGSQDVDHYQAWSDTSGSWNQPPTYWQAPKKDKRRPSRGPSPRKWNANATWEEGMKGPMQQSPKKPAKEKAKGNKGGGKGKQPSWQDARPTSQQSAPSAPSASDQHLRTLVNLLKKNADSLSPDVQAALKEASVAEQQNATKSLHKVVNKMDQATRAHEAACLARGQLHAAWKSFVEEAVEHWTRYVEEFKEDDAKLQTRVKETKDQLHLAKQAWMASKATPAEAAASTTEQNDAMLISDDEDVFLDQRAEKLGEGLSQMLTNLTSVKARAAEINQAEDGRRKAARTAARGNGEDLEEPDK